MINIIGNTISNKFLNGGGGGSGIVYTNTVQGTYGNPVNGGSSLDGSYTYGIPQTRNFTQTVTGFKIYCTVAGTVKLKKLVPTNGGFNVVDITTLNCIIGLNTFTVSFTLEANSIVAIKPGTATVSYISDSSEFHMGYSRFTGDITGSNQISESFSYRHEIQAQFTTKYDSTIKLSPVLLTDNYSGNVLPNYGVNNTTSPWIFAGGVATNAGIGLTNFLDFYPSINANDQYFKVRFEFTGAADRFCIYKKPILDDGGSIPYGTIIEADLANNRLVLYQGWTGKVNYTLPAVRTNFTLTNLTLATGVIYELELVKDHRLTIAIITNTVTQATQRISADGHPNILSGYCYGRPGYAALAGTIEVSSHEFGVAEANPTVVIIGDSISGGGTSGRDTGFADLIRINAPTGRVEAEGGTLTINILKRLRHVLRYCKPKYVVVQSVNNKADVGQVAAYAAQMPEIRQEVINAGSDFWLMVQTPMSNPTESTHQQSNRTFALAQGWNLIRTDTALSVGGDGFTYNASLYADSVHPNELGHIAKYNQAVVDCPGLFELDVVAYPDLDASYDTDYKTFLNTAYSLSTITHGYDLPTSECQDIENALVVEAKSIGLWNAAPVFFKMLTNGGKKYSLLNLKNPLLRAIVYGKATYTPKVGWGGDSNSARIDFRFTPSITGGALFTQNDAAIAWYNSKVSPLDGGYIFGGSGAGNTRELSFVRVGANSTVFINGNGAGLAFGAGNFSGLGRLYRSASNAFGSERNGVVVGTNSAVSTGLCENPIMGLCKTNGNTTLQNFSDAELGLFVPHKYSSVGRVALNTMWATYKAAIDAL